MPKAFVRGARVARPLRAATPLDGRIGFAVMRGGQPGGAALDSLAVQE